MSETLNNLNAGVGKNQNFSTQKDGKTSKIFDLGGGRNSDYSGRDSLYFATDVGRPVNEGHDVAAGPGKIPSR